MFNVKSSRRRIEAALNLEEPDILPIFELAIHPPVTSKILGRETLYRAHGDMLEWYAKGKHREANQKWVEDDIELHRKLGLDAIRIGVHYIFPESLVPKRVGEDTWELTTRLEGRSESLYLETGMHIRYLRKSNVLWPLDSPLQQKPREVLRYIEDHWDETKTAPDAGPRALEMVSKEVGDEMLVIGDADGTFSSFGKGMEKLLIWMYTHPDVVRRWTDFKTRKAIELGKACIDVGANAIIMQDDYACKDGPFMTPKHFKEFVVPSLKRQVDAFHKRGAYAIKHTDGNINLILDDIVGTGIDALQCIDPGAGMEIREVKEKYGGRICLMGNLNIDTLSRGSVDENVNMTKKCIRAATPGGGHVLGTSNDVHVGVKFENYMAALATAREYGKYPINRQQNL